ncbi:MAG: hypothetical protein IKF78_00360 [Atopobiaceae bacterium]|nr:hypothetical protein [Atopobiaceae bacterium]
MVDTYHEYMADVLAGAFVTSGKIKKLCAKLKARGDTYKRWHYDRAKADHAIRFIEAFCCQTSGEIGQKLKLEPFQRFMLSAVFGWVDDKGNREFQEVLVIIGRKNGKALSLDTEIPTPDGWRRMVDIHAGDYVFGQDGKPSEVLIESDVFDKPMYLVTFEDGATIKASGDHIWTVQSKKSKKACAYTPRSRGRLTNYRDGGWYEVTTAEIAEGFVRVRKDGKGCEYLYRVPMNEPVKYSEKELPVDPYLLGAWLGDGTSKNTHITICDEDAPEMLLNLMKCGYAIRRLSYPSDANKAPVYYIDPHPHGWRVEEGSFRYGLKTLGVLGNKHIPDIYMQASIEQRWELLRGLMDTDGYCGTNGECEFTQKSKRLSKQLVELCASLGIKASIRSKQATCNGKPAGIVYRVTFFTDKEHSCFKLSRKHARLKDRLAPRMSCKSIVSIERIPNEPSKCIAIDNESHLYLAGRQYTATHNTTLAAAIMQYLMVADGEYGPQIYTMACTDSQAALCFGGAKKMMKQSPSLKRRERMGTVPERRRQGILHEANDGYITTLTMSTELDGLDVHGAVCDEIAAWKSDGPYNDVKQGMSARKQPLMFEITTAGFVRNSIYDTQYSYASRWLDGEIEDDRFIPFIWELDRTDDWMHDESCWYKANPGLGTIKSIDTLRGFVQRAINEPSFRPTVLTKDFNVPQNSSTAWLTWEESGSDERIDFWNMGFRYCIIGFDYAQSVDLAAAQVLCMRPERNEDGSVKRDDDGAPVFDPHIYETSMYWIPEAKFDAQETKGDKATKDHAPYRLWRDQGLLRVVPGNAVPVSVLANFINELRDEHGLYTFAIGYDPWHILGGDRELLEQMIGPDRCEQVIQGAKTLSDPMYRIRADYQQGRFVDDAHPINRWCRMNVMAIYDTNLNILPDKKEAKGANKIDGFMAELDGYIALLKHEAEYKALIS